MTKLSEGMPVEWMWPKEIPRKLEDFTAYLLMMNEKAKNNRATLNEVAQWGGYNEWLKIQIAAAAQLAVMWHYIKEEWKHVKVQVDQVPGTTGDGKDNEAPPRS